MLDGGKICPTVIVSATLIRWFMTVRPQTSRLPTIRLAAITSPMLMVIRRICFPWSARLCGLADLDSLEAKLTHLRATGATSIKILDAGCGLGTWLRRLVTRAHAICGMLTFDVAAPTISVDSIEKARHFNHDSYRDRCEIELCNGRHIELNFHHVTASELRSCFVDHFDIEDWRGLDLFHNRFAPDPREPDALSGGQPVFQ